MSDKSNLVSLLSILFILVVLLDTTLAAGRRDENPSEGHKYFSCTPGRVLENYPDGGPIRMEINCNNRKMISCEADSNGCNRKAARSSCFGFGLDFDKFTPDGGKLIYTEVYDIITSAKGFFQVKFNIEIDRATGDYVLTKQDMITDGMHSIGWGTCESDMKN